MHKHVQSNCDISNLIANNMKNMKLKISYHFIRTNCTVGIEHVDFACIMNFPWFQSCNFSHAAQASKRAEVRKRWERILYKMTEPRSTPVILLQTATTSGSIEFVRLIVSNEYSIFFFFFDNSSVPDNKMDIRLLTLLLFISVTGSFADLRSPLFRFRRSE